MKIPFHIACNEWPLCPSTKPGPGEKITIIICIWWNETLGPWDKTNQEQSIHCLNAQCPGTCVMSQRHCEAAQDCSKPLQNLRGQRRAQVQREHAWNGKDGQWLSCKSRKASKPQSEADDPAHHMGTVLKMQGSQKKTEVLGIPIPTWFKQLNKARNLLSLSDTFIWTTALCQVTPDDQTCADKISALKCSLLSLRKSQTCWYYTSYFISFGATSLLIS